MLWGLYSKRISKAAVWASFIVGVGLTTVNMIMGFVGTPLIASPINAGAIAMILSIVIVPVVSLFTKAVPFEVNPPSPESGTDRELYAELEAMPMQRQVRVARSSRVPTSRRSSFSTRNKARKSANSLVRHAPHEQRGPDLSGPLLVSGKVPEGELHGAFGTVGRGIGQLDATAHEARIEEEGA